MQTQDRPGLVRQLRRRRDAISACFEANLPRARRRPRRAPVGGTFGFFVPESIICGYLGRPVSKMEKYPRMRRMVQLRRRRNGAMACHSRRFVRAWAAPTGVGRGYLQFFCARIVLLSVPEESALKNRKVPPAEFRATDVTIRNRSKGIQLRVVSDGFGCNLEVPAYDQGAPRGRCAQQVVCGHV